MNKQGNKLPHEKKEHENKQIKLEKRQTEECGTGVYAKEHIKKGQFIFEFTGEIVKAEDMPEMVGDVGDYYGQIGEDLYMGPNFEGYDDYFNHSCNPNAGLKVNGTEVKLYAIRDINPEDEITWDYSTMMDDSDKWELECRCASSNCRGKVKDFKHLDKNTQKHYLNLGVVPEYIARKYK